MLEENMAVSVTDVLSFHQKEGHFIVPKRNFSAISLRLNAPGKYFYKNKTVTFEPPSICIIPEGVSYERTSGEEDDLLVIHFNILNLIMEDIKIFKVTDSEKYIKLFGEALKIRQQNASGAFYRQTAILYDIFGELIKDCGAQYNNSNSIVESAEYMKQKFSDPQLSIEKLALRANVSPAQYRRKFHQIFGKSPKEYLSSLRFCYAKSLLETGYFSQNEIAFRCGFSDVDYFRTAFKHKYGKCIKDYCNEAFEQTDSTRKF